VPLSAGGVSISTYEDSATRRRKDIRKKINEGDLAGAIELQTKWNIDHPDNPISPKFLENAQSRITTYATATRSEQKLMNLSESDRADFIFKELKSLPTANDRSIYLNELNTKGILTPKVFKRLKALQSLKKETRNEKANTRRPAAFPAP